MESLKMLENFDTIDLNNLSLLEGGKKKSLAYWEGYYVGKAVLAAAAISVFL